MSGKGGKGINRVSAIPAASREIVLSLKEIVNCPEAEIYAMLKECNMDPNDAVNRLLVQDPFHEVKSKREKKKENKETSDSRSRSASNTLNRGSRGVTDRRIGRGASTQFSSTENGSLHSKPAYKKESETYGFTSSASGASGMAGYNTNRRSPSHSDNITAENKMSIGGTGDAFSLSSQASPGFQSSWLGAPGQVSMADIVKMGRPHGKASVLSNTAQHNGNQHHGLAPSTAPQDDSYSRDYASKVIEMKSDYGFPTSQHISPNDEWPIVEQRPAASVSSILEAPVDTELYPDSSNLPLDRTDQHIKSELEEDQESEDEANDSSVNLAGLATISSRNIQEDSCRDSSLFGNDLHENMNSYHPNMNAYERNEDNDSSLASNMRQLNLQNDNQTDISEEKPSVLIPNHLQVHTPECSHLSFGSFGSFASGPQKSNLEETSTEADAPLVGHSENISSDYYGDEHPRPSSDGSLVHRMGPSAGSYEPPSTSEPEVLKQDIPDAAQGNQYAFPTSAPGYAFENAQHAAYDHSQMSSQIQNPDSFSSVMAYTNSLPSNLLASTVQSARDSDLPYSPFPMAQSMATKYGNVNSSIGGSTIAMTESMRAGNISSPQPTLQTLSGNGFATGPALPQHLAVHPYSQPTLPLGHFANMIGYPFLPQSYPYMPSAFQQAFAGSSTYHQSLAAMLPQYKNSVSVSSLPQSAAIASGYGFGNSTIVPGNVLPNQPAAPTGAAMNYDDVISSQYKDANHLISLQQNDNSGMWVPGSRTMPGAVPASTYYGFQGQNQQQQQPGGFRQAQQLSQQFGGLGYPNFYHSQTGMSQEQLLQQNPRDGSHSQGQQSKQQLWQNSY